MKKKGSIFYKSMVMIAGLFLLTGGVLAQSTTGQKETANITYNQDVKRQVNPGITIELQKVPLSEALERIAKQAGAGLYYNTTLLPEKEVSVTLEDVPLSKALKIVLAGTRLEAFATGRNIMLREKKVILKELVPVPMQETITGTVTDASTGETLPGVNIVVKGTTTGTSTNANGEYELTVESLQDTLVFSFIGYQRQEVPINGRTEIDIIMQPQTIAGEELVVVGYGTQKKSDLTGSVASVKGEEINKVAITSVDQSLQGRVAGVQVNQSSAAPGGGVSVRIRGVNSINGTNEPLYVIDGIPIISNDRQVSATGGGRGNVPSSSLASINPGDIQSVEILKDASATAIYGARGANGVVIITTNQGRAGRTVVDYENYYGVQEVANTYDLLDARTFGMWANEFALNEGEDPYFNQQELDSLGRNGINWQDQIYRMAPMQNHQLTISGGNEKTTFALGGNFFNQNGIIKRSGFERYSLRFNFDHKISDKFKVGNSLMVSRLNNNRTPTDGNVDGVTTLAQDAPPIVPPRNPDGSYVRIEEYGVQLDERLNLAPTPNPLSKIFEVLDEERTTRLLGNFYGEYEFTEGLKLKLSVGANYSDRGRDTYFSQLSEEARNVNGRAITGTSERLIVLNDNTLSYNKVFNNKHQIDLVTGFSTQFEQFINRTMENSGFGRDDADLNIYDIGAGTQAGGPQINSYKEQQTLASYLMRVAYNYDDKYLVTFTGRGDGSSKFSEGNKWGFFPSLGLGWRVNNESFMRAINWVSNFKIRGSWGQSGFQEIDPYQSLARYGSENYSFGNMQVVGYAPVSPASRDLTWQKTEQIDIGFDAGFINNSLTFTADYYVKNTEDLLLFVRPPANTGFSSPLALNIGEVRNKGWELSLGTNIASQGGFSWSSSFNISGNNNEVLSLGPQEQIFGGQIYADRKDPGNLTRVGSPIGVFYGYRSDGIFASDQEVQQHTSLVDGNEVVIQPDAQAGDRRFIDTNGDGLITGDDRIKTGDPYPEFIYGFSNNFYYKNFDLSFFVQGTQGNEILNVASETLKENTAETNILVERYENRWTPQNTNAEYPRAGADNPIAGGSGGFGDYVVEDGSYLRLKDITIGYSLPSNLEWMSIRKARLYISAQNIFTITNYSGINPENSSFGQQATNFGVDTGGYPIAKIYRVGINLGF